MQPAASIPPLTKEGVQKLVGSRCSVPMMSNPKKRWWVEIKEVKFINQNSAAVSVCANHLKFGNTRWIELRECRWRNHVEDPLVLQIAKARAERTK
jgi:hypothetical protein